MKDYQKNSSLQKVSNEPAVLLGKDITTAESAEEPTIITLKTLADCITTFAKECNKK